MVQVDVVVSKEKQSLLIFVSKVEKRAM